MTKKLKIDNLEIEPVSVSVVDCALTCKPIEKSLLAASWILETIRTISDSKGKFFGPDKNKPTSLLMKRCADLSANEINNAFMLAIFALTQIDDNKEGVILSWLYSESIQDSYSYFADQWFYSAIKKAYTFTPRR